MHRHPHTEKLTSEWIDFDRFTQLERFFHILSFNALDSQTRETAGHVRVVDDDGAHALLTALFPDQVMGMRSVWSIFCNTCEQWQSLYTKGKAIRRTYN